MASGPFDGGGRSGEQIQKGSPFADDEGAEDGAELPEQTRAPGSC